MLQHGNLFFSQLLIAAMAGNVECNLRHYCARSGKQYVERILIDWLKKFNKFSLTIPYNIVLVVISLNVEDHWCYCYRSIDVSNYYCSLIGTFVPLLLDKFGIDPL
jgi:hypothetical protein